MNEWLLLAILFALVVKHFIADFILQTPSMVTNKGTWMHPDGLLHSAIHGILTFLVVLHPAGVLLAAVAASIDFVLHYCIDWAKMNLGRGLTVADRRFWIYLGLDQTLHIMTYLGIAGLILLYA